MTKKIDKKTKTQLRLNIEKGLRYIISDDYTNEILDLIFDDVVSDIEETADDDFNDCDIKLAIGRSIIKRMEQKDIYSRPKNTGKNCLSLYTRDTHYPFHIIDPEKNIVYWIVEDPTVPRVRVKLHDGSNFNIDKASLDKLETYFFGEEN